MIKSNYDFFEKFGDIGCFVTGGDEYIFESLDGKTYKIPDDWMDEKTKSLWLTA